MWILQFFLIPPILSLEFRKLAKLLLSFSLSLSLLFLLLAELFCVASVLGPASLPPVLPFCFRFIFGTLLNAISVLCSVHISLHLAHLGPMGSHLVISHCHSVTVLPVVSTINLWILPVLSVWTPAMRPSCPVHFSQLQSLLTPAVTDPGAVAPPQLLHQLVCGLLTKNCCEIASVVRPGLPGTPSSPVSATQVLGVWTRAT